MPSTHVPPRSCHWEVIQGPRHDGRAPATVVWICEYPYRTIRVGPSDDCESCRTAEGATRSWPGRPAAYQR